MIVVPQSEPPARGIALALGGGAARGWAHIGVLRALDEGGIPIRMVAGTSVGALVGGCYLAGHLDELEEFARSLTPRRVLGFLDFKFRGAGLISGVLLAEEMSEHLKEMRIEQLSRPLVCVATEIHTGHEVWLTEGPLIDAMRASYALPGIFEPVRLGGRVLVDGALVNPVPVPVCRSYEADAVVAVNLSSDIFGRGTVVRNGSSDHHEAIHDARPDLSRGLGFGPVARMSKALGITGTVVEAFNIIMDRMTRSRLAGDPPDLSIIPAVGDLALSDFHRAADFIDVGYAATWQEMGRLRKICGLGPIA